MDHHIIAPEKPADPQAFGGYFFAQVIIDFAAAFGDIDGVWHMHLMDRDLRCLCRLLMGGEKLFQPLLGLVKEMVMLGLVKAGI